MINFLVELAFKHIFSKNGKMSYCLHFAARLETPIGDSRW